MNSPEYLRAADRLAQEVVNAWEANVSARNTALLTPQFKALFETARRYRDAKNLANNHRKHNVLQPRERKLKRRAHGKSLGGIQSFRQGTHAIILKG